METLIAEALAKIKPTEPFRLAQERRSWALLSGTSTVPCDLWWNQSCLDNQPKKKILEEFCDLQKLFFL
jgi:hypothetical protein